MLPVSLDCLFLIAPSVSGDQCCICLWIVYNSRMDNPETQATLGTRHRRGNQKWTIQRHRQHWALDTEGELKNEPILDCPFCVWWPMLHMSLDCLFLIVPSVSSAQYWLCLWTFHSWLPLLFLVPWAIMGTIHRRGIKNRQSGDTDNIGH
jgi:hypothetical protein